MESCWSENSGASEEDEEQKPLAHLCQHCGKLLAPEGHQNYSLENSEVCTETAPHTCENEDDFLEQKPAHTCEGCEKMVAHECDLSVQEGDKIYATENSEVHTESHTCEAEEEDLLDQKPAQTCEGCGKMVAPECNLSVQHLSHGGEKNYATENSEVCAETVPQTCEEEEEPPSVWEEDHVCQVCGKKLASKYSLTLHHRTHTREKPYRCDICESRFSQKSALTRHESVHTSEKKHTCQLCQKTFRRRNALIEHLKVHTGEKPHECEVCGKNFSFSGALRKHRMKHTGEKPHECEVCAKRFARFSCLRHHLLTHTGEKPHVCTECGKRFRQRRYLKQHVLAHARQKLKCNVCGRCFPREALLQYSPVHAGAALHSCHECWTNYTRAVELQSRLQIQNVTADREMPTPQVALAFTLGSFVTIT